MDNKINYVFCMDVHQYWNKYFKNEPWKLTYGLAYKVNRPHLVPNPRPTQWKLRGVVFQFPKLEVYNAQIKTLLWWYDHNIAITKTWADYGSWQTSELNAIRIKKHCEECLWPTNSVHAYCPADGNVVPHTWRHLFHIDFKSRGGQIKQRQAGEGQNQNLDGIIGWLQSTGSFIYCRLGAAVGVFFLQKGFSGHWVSRLIGANLAANTQQWPLLMAGVSHLTLP